MRRNDSAGDNIAGSGAEPTKRRIRRQLLWWIGYLLFILVFVEIGLQTFYYLMAGDFLFARVGLPIYAPHEHSGHRNKPNLDVIHATNEFRVQLYTNSQGFRVADRAATFAVEKDPSRYRIMLVGPSFAFGWGVDYEDSFAAKLEELLEQGGFAHGRDIEVINAGVPALPTRSQFAWYENEGRKYNPDLMIQMLHGSMSVPPATNAAVNEDGYLVSKAGRSKRLRAIAKNSAIVFYAWITYNRIASEMAPEVAEGRIEGAGGELELQRSFDPTDQKTTMSLEFYDRLRSVNEVDGIRLVLVHFPLSYCVHRTDISRWRHLGVRDIDNQIKYESSFCAHLREQGFECLNLTSDLIDAAESGERLYYWLDIHWTPYGNLVAAKTVATYLLSEGSPIEDPLVPEGDPPASHSEPKGPDPISPGAQGSVCAGPPPCCKPLTT